MDLFDTHAHLTEIDNDPVAYCKQAVDAGVNRVLFCASGMEECRNTAHFAAACENFYFAVGVHPHEAQNMMEQIADFRKFERKYTKSLVAIGELGLDYYYDLSPREKQMTIFRNFLELALDMELPAIVHCRDKDNADDAYADCYQLLENFSSAGGEFVLHAYAGSVDWMTRFAELGARFGVGGMLTFKRAENIREVVAKMPLDRIILETDAPYLAPVPFRGKTNHPSLLPYTAQALANLTGKTTEEISALTTANALKLFKRIKA